MRILVLRRPDLGTKGLCVWKQSWWPHLSRSCTWLISQTRFIFARTLNNSMKNPPFAPQRTTAGHCGAKPSLAPAAPAAIPESLAMQQNPSELLIASASFLTMSKVVSNTICRRKFLNSRRCLVQDQGFVPRAALPSIANGVSLVRYIHP